MKKSIEFGNVLKDPRWLVLSKYESSSASSLVKMGTPEDILLFMETHQDMFRFNGSDWIAFDIEGTGEDSVFLSKAKAKSFVTICVDEYEFDEFKICLTGWFFVEKAGECMTDEENLSSCIDLPVTEKEFVNSIDKMLSKARRKGLQVNKGE